MDRMEEQVAIAAFHDHATAERAVADLHAHDFGHHQVGIVSRDEKGEHGVEHLGRDHAKGTAAGIGSGALVGGIAGAAVALAIPGAGPVIAAGVLATTLVGAGTGAVVGGLLGALTGMGIPKRQAEYYNREFEAGRSLVVVLAESRADEARQLLRRNGGYAMDEAPGVTPSARDEDRDDREDRGDRGDREDQHLRPSSAHDVDPQGRSDREEQHLRGSAAEEDLPVGMGERHEVAPDTTGFAAGAPRKEYGSE